MKKSILTAIIANGLALGAGHGALVAHYALDETSGTTVADSSANGTTGTITGTGGDLSAVGVANTAFDTNGTADITTPDNSLGISGNDARTISFWFNASSVARRGRIIGMGDQAAAQTFDITFENSTGGNSVGLRYGNGNMFWSGGGITLGSWTHVVMTYDGTTLAADTNLLVYLNGTLAARDGGNGNNSGQALRTTDRMRIGNLVDTGDYRFDGVVDDVQIYDSALSQNDVTFLHDNPGQTVPEPSATGLLGALGLLGLLRRRRI